MAGSGGTLLVKAAIEYLGSVTIPARVVNLLWAQIPMAEFKQIARAYEHSWEISGHRIRSGVLDTFEVMTRPTDGEIR